MNLLDNLYGKKDAIVSEWHKAVIDTFPADSSKFFLEVKDKFANPMGFAFMEELPFIFDGIFGKCERQRYELALENIIRIRAVQKLSPADACGYILLLKQILWQNAGSEIKDRNGFVEFLELEAKIDKASGLSFNYYMAMKEKIFEIKANEVKNTFGRMVDKLNAKYGRIDNN